MKKMKALVYEKPGRKNGFIKEIDYPSCGDDEIIIKVMACGICKPAERSHDEKGSLLGVYPAVPGHEFAGVVEEIGKDVKNFKVGDRVTADNAVSCGTCYYCQAGKPAFCLNYKSIGHSVYGGMAEYVLVKESMTFSIPDNLTMNEACLTELVGCCFHCVERADIKYGDNVLVLGCGSSGMLLAQLFKNSQAGKVVVADVNPMKLKHIEAKGVITCQVDREDYAKHESRLKDDFPLGFDCIIDTTGDFGLVNRCISILKKGGTFVEYSFASTDKKSVEINIAPFIANECSFIGTTFQSFSFKRCLEVMSEGKVDASFIISKEYALDEYFDALDENLNNTDTIKMIIHPN
ncbi:MAG: alcohol dehydrogenase catalytic domain-containing protein [Suipraeoptans sp.]